MTDTIIDRIRTARRLEDLLDVNDLSAEFNRIALEIHPDHCKSPFAHEAMSRLNELRSEYIHGQSYSDDAGEYRSNGRTVVFTSDAKLLRRSYDNYLLLKRLNDDASRNFQRYLPESATFDGTTLVFTLLERAVPLVGKQLPQEHVNWILSRLLEFSSWLAQVGMVHCGLNPESVMIVPENHGIQVCSFYHLTQLNHRLRTISGKYRNWYPQSVFIDKKATSTIDLELSQKTAIYLLGDHSGSGVKLKATHHAAFMDFVIAQHHDAYRTFSDYRTLLSTHFPKKFHVLDL